MFDQLENFINLYKEPESKVSIEGKGIFYYRTNVISGIEWWAVNNASEIDNISAKFYKNTIIKHKY